MEIQIFLHLARTLVGTYDKRREKILYEMSQYRDPNTPKVALCNLWLARHFQLHQQPRVM